MANYSMGRKELPEIENGHKFNGDNFCQLQPHTPLFEGKSGLEFDSCNLINCDLPADTVRKFANNAQVSWCTNLHPEFIELGLDACGENCVHVIDTDSVTIDGQAIGVNYHYQDKLVS
jgi:hypothetical protein